MLSVFVLRFCHPVEAETQNYLLECKVYRVLGNFDGSTSLTDPIWDGTNDPLAQASPEEWIKTLTGKEGITVFNLADLEDIGGAHLIANATGWTWDGQTEPPSRSGFPSVSLISAPKVLNHIGSSFSIMFGPSNPSEYFERLPNGLFKLVKQNLDTGIKIGSGVVEVAQSGRLILHDLEVSVGTIDQREPIEGTSLDVGKPIPATRSFKKTISIKPDVYYGISFYFDKYGTVLLQLRMTLYSSQESGDSPEVRSQP